MVQNVLKSFPVTQLVKTSLLLALKPYYVESICK